MAKHLEKKTGDASKWGLQNKKEETPNKMTDTKK